MVVNTEGRNPGDLLDKLKICSATLADGKGSGAKRTGKLVRAVRALLYFSSTEINVLRLVYGKYTTMLDMDIK